MLIIYKQDGAVVYAEKGYPVKITDTMVLSGRGVSVGVADGWSIDVLVDSPVLNALITASIDGVDWYSDLIYPRDFPGNTSDIDRYAALDAATGDRINRQIHPLCGDTEALGILREQMVLWGNKLGLDFTEDFTRLNEIAITEIRAGTVKKAAITDA